MDPTILDGKNQIHFLNVKKPKIIKTFKIRSQSLKSSQNVLNFQKSSKIHKITTKGGARSPPRCFLAPARASDPKNTIGKQERRSGQGPYRYDWLPF